MQPRSTIGLEKLSITDSAPAVKMRPPQKAKDRAKVSIKEEALGTQVSVASNKQRSLPRGTPNGVPEYTPLNIRPLGSETGSLPHTNALISPFTPYPITKGKNHHTLATRSLDPQRPKPKKSHATSKKNSHDPSHYVPAKTRKASSASTAAPTELYLSQAAIPPSLLDVPQKFLIVLDLNGTLLFRKKNSSGICLRPHVSSFVEYCLAHHSVMVWSSARPENVKRMCQKVFTPQQRKTVIAEWDRDRLGLSEEHYNAKVQVYKRLSSIWSDEDLQKRCPGHGTGEKWGQHNTVLVDDGLEKGKSECWNLLQVPEFENPNVASGADSVEEHILAQAVGWIEEARRWSDVSAFCSAMGKAFTVDGGWKWDWKPGVQAGQSTIPMLPQQPIAAPDLHDESTDTSSDSDSGGGVSIVEAVSRKDKRVAGQWVPQPACKY